MDSNNSRHINTFVREDLVRLVITIGIVILVIAGLAIIQQKTNVISKLFPFQIASPQATQDQASQGEEVQSTPAE